MDLASPTTYRPTLLGTRHMVVSGHSLASMAGMRILEAGGTAVDAGVAAGFALNVVQPDMASLGGVAPILIYDAQTAAVSSIGGVGRWPRAVTLEGLRRAGGGRIPVSPQRWVVPATVDAWLTALERFGTMTAAEVLQPAIELAEQGFPAHYFIRHNLAGSQAAMTGWSHTAEVFFPEGRLPAPGEPIAQRALGATLRSLTDAERVRRGSRADGIRAARDHFYKGEIAERIGAFSREAGGYLTADDLRDFSVRVEPPASVTYRGRTVYACGPWSQGPAVLQMLKLLEGYTLADLDGTAANHLLIEITKLALMDRNRYFGDPDFVKVPQRLLTSRDYAAGLRATINPAKATPSDLLSGEQTPLEDDETTHFSIIDAEGNRAAVTQTVNLLFGSGLVPPGTGVLLNNEMDDFALKPGTPNAFGVMGYDANAPQPGKRMLSSMTPTFMQSPDRVVVIGTPGGSRIITMVLLGILGYDAGLDAQAVAALPRYHHQWMPDVIEAESGAFAPTVAQALRGMGHALKLPGDEAEGGRGSSHVWGNLQTVEWDLRDNVLHGGSDPRNPVGKAAVEKVGARTR